MQGWVVEVGEEEYDDDEAIKHKSARRRRRRKRQERESCGKQKRRFLWHDGEKLPRTLVRPFPSKNIQGYDNIALCCCHVVAAAATIITAAVDVG